jgi:hypothetical protein
MPPGARMAMFAGDFASAQACLDEAVASVTEPSERATLLCSEGGLAAELSQRDRAIQAFTQAIDLYEELGDATSAAVIRGELAMVHTHFEEHGEAERLLAESIDFLESSDRTYLHAHMLTNRAVLRLDARRPDEARLDLEDALALLDIEDHAYGRAVALAVQGLALLDRAEPARACLTLERALALAVGRQFALLEVRIRMRLAGALGWIGDEKGWRRQSTAVRRLLARGSDHSGAAVFSLYAGLRELHRGRLPEVFARLKRATEGEGAVVRLDDEARLVRRLLERHLPGALSFRCSPSGGVVMLPDGACVDVTRFAACHRILAALLDAAEGGPQPLQKPALFEAGWPGEHIAPSSAGNRLRVELSRLRRLGLKPWLQAHEGGYRLDPEVRVVRAELSRS